MDSWLDLSHQLVDEEFSPVLKAAGFKKQRSRWSRRRPGGGTDTLVLQWTMYARRDSDFVHFWCVEDGRAKTYAMPAEWHVGSQVAQVDSFRNSGQDELAEEILGPLGLLDLYRQTVSVGSYSKNTPMPRDPRDVERVRRLKRWTHRYRWWVPEDVRAALRHDVKALLVVFEKAAYMPLGPFLGERIAEGLEAAGLERFFVV